MIGEIMTAHFEWNVQVPLDLVQEDADHCMASLIGESWPGINREQKALKPCNHGGQAIW